MNEETRNEQLASNPRYQPAWLKPYFGYDNLYRYWAIIEIALLKALAFLKIIKPEVISLLTPEAEQTLLNICTTEVDKAERGDKTKKIKGTRHDIRAWIKVAREKPDLPWKLTRWLHWGFTSYDVISTALALMFKEAYEKALRPRILKVIWYWAALAERYEDTLQIGRTHGQHAEPITAGLWIATCLARVIDCYLELERSVDRLTGKVSGPVGAFNAQEFFGLGFGRSTTISRLEELVLNSVGLRVPMASTQIALPERIADFLWCCYKLSEAFAQMFDDCRQLMRTEIGEVAEGFEEGQDGSSAMPWKRNPLTFENIVGMADNAWREFMGVFKLFRSEHQRDLKGSSIMRQLQAVVDYLAQQIDTLLKPGDENPLPFILRIVADEKACLRNFAITKDVIMAQAAYMALVKYDYPEDPHSLMNHVIIPLAKSEGLTLTTAIARVAESNPDLQEAWRKIPASMKKHLDKPELYTGIAKQRTQRIVRTARNLVNEACARYHAEHPTEEYTTTIK